MDKSSNVHFSLLRRRGILKRIDVTPPVILYIVLGVIYQKNKIGELTSFLILLGVSICHLVLYLSNFWSAKWESRISYSSVSEVGRASHVLISKKYKKQGRTRRSICPLGEKNISREESVYCVEHCKVRYTYDEQEKEFQQTRFEVQETFGFYRGSTGVITDEDLIYKEGVFGTNSFPIPMPRFLDLFKEHIVAPFFIFQLFSTSLWLFDEYPKYALLTLVMLFMFEGMVCKTRMMNLERLRKMRITPKMLQVYRKGSWEDIRSDMLVAGDLVSIVRRAEEAENIIPCDILLLTGSAVVDESMLTGETVPQIKESIKSTNNEDVFNMKSVEHKIHVLFGGCRIIQSLSDHHLPSKVNKHPQGQSCIGYVLRTGFGTTQGKLMRTILFTTDRVTVESKETYFFLLLLLVPAMLASGYVFSRGLENPERNEMKVVLKCLQIFTAVIPPELPMELSLAVNNSILQLTQKSIFCTEPFRIPFSGKVDICCFDKTGTLTSDKLKVNGIAGVEKDLLELEELRGCCYYDILLVLGCCHTLITQQKKVVGDPIEKAAFEMIKWKYDKERETATSADGAIKAALQQRFQFNSTLKRMSVIIKATLPQANGKGATSMRLVTKGAPEVMKELLVEVPPKYEEEYEQYMKKGGRVLALAYRELPQDIKPSKVLREEVECELKFCGFLICRCPMKPDSCKHVRMLQQSSHQVIMITGDNAYTAAHVAGLLGLGSSNNVAFSDKKDGQVEWRDINGNLLTTDISDIPKLAKKYCLCLNGECLAFYDTLLPQKSKSKLLYEMRVFARVSPSQKDYIIGVLNSGGHTTLMCGDGTNDVGSLKRAHIGISLMNKCPPTMADGQKKKRAKGMLGMMREAAEEAAERKAGRLNASNSSDRPMGMRSAMKMMDNNMVDLGDACIAAPFTYKFESIKCVLKVLKQGRCTLVTTFQMYKILAINCLLNGYSLSVLYLDGVKNGDDQMFIGGIMIAVYFFIISRAKPLKTLSVERPPNGVFQSTLLFSVFGQFAIHFFFLQLLLNDVQQYIVKDQMVPDTDFVPNVINTVIFLYISSIEASTYWINYYGRPFMEDIKENKFFMRCLFFHILGLFVLAMDFIPELREYFQLVELPSEDLKWKLLGCMAMDIMLVYALEKFIIWCSLFKYRKLRKRGNLTPTAPI